MTVNAVVTGDPGRADRARQALPHARVLPDADQVFARASEHDFVVVAAPNDAHVPLARRALDAGLPVVVDKPLAPSAEEGRRLIEHAERLELLITVFLNRRWDSDQLTIRRLLAEGRLGGVLRQESRLERWRPELNMEKEWRELAPPSAGGGVLLDLGTHLVDQALQLFGPVSHVYAEIEGRRGAPADDDAFLAHLGALAPWATKPVRLIKGV